MGKLYEKLVEYGKSDYYPYHMPGHKRNMKGYPLEAYYKTDITEIDGFDNLHQAEGLLRDVEERINQIYGADETFLLINGSTSGILSAVSCVAGRGDKILIARNCHKSVYHGAYLRDYDIRYVYPNISSQFEIAMGIIPEKVYQVLKSEEGICAVVITSPTYDGIVSDVVKIAEIVHAFHIPLIIDEAHGAHFGLFEGAPFGAIEAGADIVIHSLHKTLPSPTQTALLHLSGNVIDKRKLKRYLSIYQSSSPSYPLMAGMELCFDLIEKDGQRLFGQMLENWEEMLGRLERCKAFRILRRQDVLGMGMKDFDVGKLVVSTKGTKWSGQKLYEVLLEKYHLQLEMAGNSYVLAMFTMMDTKEGYERLTRALLELDEQVSREVYQTEADIGERYVCPKVSCKIAEALDAETEWIDFSESEGRTAAGFVNLYPPGIPVIVPGEIFSEEIIFNIRNWNQKNLPVQGINEKREVLVTCEKNF